MMEALQPLTKIDLSKLGNLKIHKIAGKIFSSKFE